MRWSFHVVRIGGIDVKIHVTFFLLLAWIGFIFHRSGGMPAAVHGVIFVVLIFLVYFCMNWETPSPRAATGSRHPTLPCCQWRDRAA